MSAMSPADCQRGLTLVELIVAMVVISVGVAGVLSAFNVSVRSSADPLVAKQAVALGEALVEEVSLAPFTWCDPDDANAEIAVSAGDCASLSEVLGPEAGDVRPFDNVNDYHGLVLNLLNPVSDVSGMAIPGLAGYTASIAIAEGGLPGLAAGESLRIMVTVTAPNGDVYLMEGMRTRYAPNAIP